MQLGRTQHPARGRVLIGEHVQRFLCEYPPALLAAPDLHQPAGARGEIADAARVRGLAEALGRAGRAAAEGGG